MTIQKLENIGIVVDDLDAVADFFVKLGMTVVGDGLVEGDWVDACVGLENVQCEIRMLDVAGGQGQLELMSFRSPDTRPGDRDAPPNTHGIRRIAFSVDDLDAEVAGLRERGTELLGDVVNYENVYKLCYVRGPEGIIVMLAEKLD